MKAPKIYTSLILSAALLVSSGCEKANMAPNDTHMALTATQVVTIQGCVATPDVVTVHDGESVAWRIADSGTNPPSYIIHFSGANPPTNTPFLVKSTVSDLPHRMQKDAACSTANLTACDYKYSLTRDTSTTPCADPKVHVIPGPS